MDIKSRKTVGSLNSKADTRVSFSTDLISDTSKSDDDTRLVFRHMDPGVTSNQKRKYMLTEAASKLIIQPSLPERILLLDNPASEELFRKSIACIGEILDYSRIDSSNFKTFNPEDATSLPNDQHASPALDAMSMKPQMIPETTYPDPELRRDSTFYEFTSSIEANRDGDDRDTLQLCRLSALMMPSNNKSCTANPQHFTINMDAYNRNNGNTISNKQPVSSVVPILSLNPMHASKTLSPGPRQGLNRLGKERGRCVAEKSIAITSAAIKKTLRSLSPIGPVRPPLSKIPCSPSPEDLPICVLRALDKGCWVEPTHVPRVASRAKGVIHNRQNKIQ